jgi:hypothetical protein
MRNSFPEFIRNPLLKWRSVMIPQLPPKYYPFGVSLIMEFTKNITNLKCYEVQARKWQNAALMKFHVHFWSRWRPKFDPS